MRSLWVVVHRWVGLTIAGFLIVSGLTGAVISWDQEVDALINSHLLRVDNHGDFLEPLAMARDFERENPEAWVTYAMLNPEPGRSQYFSVTPRIDPITGRPYELGYNEFYVDPVTGEELGRRDIGALWPLSRENFVSFLYVLHYSLHLPDPWGYWLFAGIALLWLVDCFVGFYLTLPPRRRAQLPTIDTAWGRMENDRPSSWWQRWRPAWQVRWRAGSYKLNFDMHRAFALWTWLILFVLALSGLMLNLEETPLFNPLMERISNFTPGPYEQRTPHELPDIAPILEPAAIVELARVEGARRGWQEPPGDIYYDAWHGMYLVGFFTSYDAFGTAGIIPPELFFDGQNGALLGAREPWVGTGADIFVEALFPLHSGRILGLPGRVLMSVMGIVVAMLSVTGIVIWQRKRRARA